ncbi:MAG: hypothetical protein QOE60_1620 [Thermoleophilaceae bacterium]|nr:hypothetical protein [Thermoleophilaceae bacterium]
MDAPARRSRVAGSLRARLLLAALAVMVPVLLGTGLWVLLLSHSTANYQSLADEAATESEASVVLLRHLNEVEEVGSTYMRTGRVTYLRQFRDLSVQVDHELSNGDLYDNPIELIPFTSMRRPWGQAKEHIATRGAHGGEQDTFAAHMHLAADGLERLMAGSHQEVERELAASDNAARLNWVLGLSAVAVALLLAALLARRLANSLVRPLDLLGQAARTLAGGDLGHRVAIKSTSELNEVGATFNAMAVALERQRGELERHAFADSLTGLANRPLFEDRVARALERAAGRADRAAMVVLDLDGFKLINDALGHSCGDALLKQAGERMTTMLRPSDTLARLGSDEFAVLLESVRGLDDALGAAERLREAFRAPFVLKGSDVLMTVSVGIALSTEATHDATELLRRADLAMYRAKAHGGNSSEFFDPAMDDQAAERLELVNALRRAVDRDELVVHYQPITDLETGEMRAAEALLRWNRSGRGLVAPLEFIPLAEETGLILPIGEWVLNAACAEAQAWLRSGLTDMPVTVNVSARQLLDSRFEAVVADALSATGLEAGRLVLEVTESVVMKNVETTIAKLDRISATGVRIALDDFGEGYSSLGQLRTLPIDILKIARPFVHELTEDDNDPALVRGIIELARSLGLRMVAEGIESPEQEAMLRAFGCPLGQGFLFARPLEPQQLHAMLAGRPGTRVGDRA